MGGWQPGGLLGPSRLPACLSGLAVDQGGEVVGGEELLGHLLYGGWRDGVDHGEELGGVFLAAVVEVALGEVEGEALAAVACHGYLPLYLLLGGGELCRGEWLLHHSVELTPYQAAATLHVVGVAPEVDAPRAGVGVAHHGAVDGVYQSVALAQGYVEPCVHARSAKHVVEQVEGHAPVVVGAVGPCAYHDVGLVGGPVGRGLAGRVGRHWPRWPWPPWRRRGEVGRGLLEQPCHPAEVDVAICEEHGVVGPVQPCRESERVGGCERAQPLGPPQYVVAERVACEESAVELVVYELGRRVVVALNLVAYHLDFLLHLLLRVSAVEDDVGEQVDGPWEVVAQDCGVVDGVFLGGEGVEVAPHAFEAVDDVPRPAPCGALERGVLAEVGHALLARALVARAGRDAVAAVDHRRRRWQVYDAQPVGQRERVVFHNGGKDTAKSRQGEVGGMFFCARPPVASPARGHR